MLKRDLSRLTHRPFDLLVIGGNALGSFIAWDATMRGLRVGLIETADFGSSNDPGGLSLIAGSMRFCDGLNLAQSRQMVKERQAFLRIAPHLIRPLSHLVVTEKKDLSHCFPLLMGAVKGNHLLNYNHNFGLDPARFLAHGRALLPKSVIEQHPPLATRGDIGAGAVWEEAQILNAQRLQLSILKSAVDGGAVVANYVRLEKLRTHRNRVVGVDAFDILSQTTMQIGARMVIDATSGAIDRYHPSSTIQDSFPQIVLYLMTRQLVADKALKFVKGKKMCDGAVVNGRSLSIIPWQACSLIGPFKTGELVEWNTETLLNQVNECFPAAHLQADDIYQVYSELIPTKNNFVAENTLFEETQLVDHAKNGDLNGFISARCAGFEHSRYLAEKTIDLMFEKLQRPSPDCRTRRTSIVGGHITHWDTFELASLEKWPYELPPYQMRRYLMHYGSQHRALLPIMSESLGHSQPVGEDTAVTKAEIIYAVRQEMAQKLSDVVLRRTEMGSTLPPSIDTLQATAQLMADECGWSKQQTNEEIDAVLASMSTLRF